MVDHLQGLQAMPGPWVNETQASHAAFAGNFNKAATISLSFGLHGGYPCDISSEWISTKSLIFVLGSIRDLCTLW